MMRSGLMVLKWRLAVVMAEREMDYKELARRSGLHPVTVNKLKNSFSAPPRIDRNTLEKLCTALNCTPGDLIAMPEK